MKDIGLISLAVSIVFASCIAAFLFRYEPLPKIPKFGGAYVLDRWTGETK